MSDGQSTVTYKDIPGNPGYKAGDDGTIWSAWYMKGLGRGAKPMIGSTWKKLKFATTKWGHKRVNLKGGKAHFVHRLILASFSRKPMPGEECRHLDGNPANNRLSNLAWGTSAENGADMVRHGRSTRGIKNPSARLTEKMVLEIRRRRKAGEKAPIIAREFDIDTSSVYQIAAGRSWGWLVGLNGE